MRIGIFEDAGYKNLYPLTYLRPAFELYCGMLSLREKIQKLLPGRNIDLFARDDLKDVILEQNPDINTNKTLDSDYLFLNGRAILTRNLLEKLAASDQTLLYKMQGEVVAAFIQAQDMNKLGTDEDGLLNFDSIDEWQPVYEDVLLLNYPWDFVHKNGDEIRSDFQLMTHGLKYNSRKIDHAYFMAAENIWISDSARIDPGVVIIAENGPVYIDDDAHLMPHTTITGPVYIGKATQVKAGARIYGGTSIAQHCHIGGEVKQSIILSYSNKQHDGYLGNAYLGEWINLGADTNNSNLKNNYGSVRVYVNGEEIDSGQTFVGLTMGDHSKSGINTMFNTGTVAGIMCNIFGSDFPPKWIPSFSWGGSAGFVEYDVDKGLAVARKVMERRNATLGPAEEKLIRNVFKKTKDERNY